MLRFQCEERGMDGEARAKRVHQRWAEFRFSLIGQLLAAPPPKGELAAAIAALAERTWHHPITDEHTRFGFSTIERWYYRALKEKRDPVGVLRRKLRVDAGQQWAMTANFSGPSHLAGGLHLFWEG
jgi:putative transposase